jgi:hypothetical protein
MSWKEQLEEHEENKEWKSAIILMQETIRKDSSTAEVYIRAIYLLHNILLEEDYPEAEQDNLEGLLLEYFDTSRKMFSTNTEYLFFIGYILYVAEWYFGLDELSGPLQESLAFKMQKNASELEPNNPLFEWAYRFSIGDEISGYLAKQMLTYNDSNVEWLKLKGFPGKYVLHKLEISKGKYLHTWLGKGIPI